MIVFILVLYILYSNPVTAIVATLVLAAMATVPGGATYTNGYNNYEKSIADSDNDGIIYGNELALGTSDSNTDSDGDGITDHNEVFVYGTNPSLVDTDNDGYSDGFEISHLWNNAWIDPQIPVYTFLWRTYSYTSYKFYTEVYNHFASPVKVFYKSHSSSTWISWGSSWTTYYSSDFLNDKVGTFDLSSYAYSQIDVKVEWWKNGVLYTFDQKTFINYNPGGGGGCVNENTNILLADGVSTRKAEDLSIGD